MDKFLSEVSSPRARQVSGDQQSVASDDAGDMDLTLGSPELIRSASLISVDSAASAASVEGGDSDKMAHLAAFFKFDKTHATCAKCGTKLKVKINK